LICSKNEERVGWDLDLFEPLHLSIKNTNSEQSDFISSICWRTTNFNTEWDGRSHKSQSVC